MIDEAQGPLCIISARVRANIYITPESLGAVRGYFLTLRLKREMRRQPHSNSNPSSEAPRVSERTAFPGLFEGEYAIPVDSRVNALQTQELLAPPGEGKFTPLIYYLLAP